MKKNISLNTVLAKIAGADDEALVEIDNILTEGVVDKKREKNADEFMSIAKTCAFLSCSRSHLWKMIKNKMLPTHSLGSRILLNKSEIVSILMEG